MEYNHHRPRGSLYQMTPVAFVAACLVSARALVEPALLPSRTQIADNALTVCGM